ncbi:cutinase family protein [Pseudarthrobacter sulfonivorans]|uniref:cutinase family protein n=1 Tax=Pseudarthrobacter sulfonivorans TaxID=121292 RepID=UPI00277DBD29|nr:cutinase family protein [Pseudarthrobacter sulfonivorans]MDP9998402.1 hypothetical protein [Pseudarthrobacter sulfonivorans]
MRSARFVVPLVILATLLTGCTDNSSEWGPGALPDEWKDVASETRDPKFTPSNTATPADFVVPERCNNSVAVIGIGNPGHGNEVEAHLTSAQDMIGVQTLKYNPSEPRRISYAIAEIRYPDGTAPVRDIIEAAPADNYSLELASKEASKAILAKMKEVEAACPGTHVVLRGHGWGAVAVREAAFVMDLYQEERVSAIWLSGDPGRTITEPIAVVPGSPDMEVFDTSNLIADDPTAGGLLPKSGRTLNAFEFSEELQDRVVTVCYSNDPVCNGGSGDVHEFLAQHGGAEAAWMTHGYRYASMGVTTPAAEHAATLLETDISDGAEFTFGARPNGSPLDPKVANYLNYVNTFIDGDEIKRHRGAKVIQDSIEPGVIVQCADYTIMGVRGSGEDIAGNAEDDKGNRLENSEGFRGGRAPHRDAPVISGFSEFLATYSWEIKKQLDDDKTIRFVPVSYQAVPVSVLFPGGGSEGEPWTVTDADSFMNSAADGAEKLSLEMTNLQIDCPDTKIVLIGYSQGAMAVHKTLLSIGHTDLTNQIKAVLLVSDPLRINSDTLPLNYLPRDNPDQFTEFSFLEKNSLGAGIGMATEFGNVYFDERLKDKIVQICDLNDIVCNASPALMQGDVGLDAHTSVYRNPTHYEFPAGWAVEKLKTR